MKEDFENLEAKVTFIAISDSEVVLSLQMIVTSYLRDDYLQQKQDLNTSLKRVVVRVKALQNSIDVFKNLIKKNYYVDWEETDLERASYTIIEIKNVTYSLIERLNSSIKEISLPIDTENLVMVAITIMEGTKVDST